MQPIEIARSMCEEVYGQGKLDLIPKLVADDVVAHDPIMGRIDRNGITENVKMFRKAFPDMRMEVVDAIGTGDKVMLRWKSTGTHKGELFGMQPSNKSVTVEGLTEVRIVNGKIQEAWDQWNALGLMRQIGAIPDTAFTAARKDGGGARATAPQQPRR